MTSYLGRLNYDYAGKYYVSGVSVVMVAHVYQETAVGEFWSEVGRLSQEAMEQSKLY
ncbi:hypothetical protein NXW62_06490 [Bacteroides fragilis]|nr:hypothetical protein [Bacteroides fragilis]